MTKDELRAYKKAWYWKRRPIETRAYSVLKLDWSDRATVRAYKREWQRKWRAIPENRLSERTNARMHIKLRRWGRVEGESARKQA